MTLRQTVTCPIHPNWRATWRIGPIGSTVAGMVAAEVAAHIGIEHPEISADGVALEVLITSDRLWDQDLQNQQPAVAE